MGLQIHIIHMIVLKIAPLSGPGINASVCTAYPLYPWLRLGVFNVKLEAAGYVL